MRHILLFLILLLLAPAGFALDVCSRDVAALNALYDLRESAIRKGPSSYETGLRIAHHLDRLRDPLPGGGHRWVRLVRPSGEPPTTKREHLVSSNFNAGEQESFEAFGEVPFAVRVVVPRKRSTLRANSQAWVGELVVRYWKDDEERVLERPIRRWMAPDTSQTFDLGIIADRAQASLSVATRPELSKQALVEIHFRQAVREDDPANPAYSTIQLLDRLRSRFDLTVIETEIARVEASLFPDAPKAIRLHPLVEALRSIDTLLASDKPEEQEKGRKLLSETAKSVR